MPDGAGDHADERSQASPLQNEARALDQVMFVLLKFIHRTCHPKGTRSSNIIQHQEKNSRITFLFLFSGKLDLKLAKSLFKDLLGAFEIFLLPTHAPGHTQFFMFYMCSIHKVI